MGGKYDVTGFLFRAFFYINGVVDYNIAQARMGFEIRFTCGQYGVDRKAMMHVLKPIIRVG